MAFQRAVVELGHAGMFQNEPVFKLNINSICADDTNDSCFRAIIHCFRHEPVIFEPKVVGDGFVVSTAWASVDAVVDATDKRIHMSDVFLTAIRAYNDDLLAAIGAYFTRGESVFVAPHFCHSRRCGCQVIDSGNNFHATAYRASEGSVFDAFDQRDDTGCVLRMTVRAHNNHLFGAVAADFVGTNRVFGTPHSSNFRVLGSQIVDSKNKLFAVMCFCFGCNSSLIDFYFLNLQAGQAVSPRCANLTRFAFVVVYLQPQSGQMAMTFSFMFVLFMIV